MNSPTVLRLVRRAGILAMLALACVLTVFGATTGKLSGRVVDQKGEALPSANVVIQGTTLGGVTDLEGYYTILNIPPGSYSVQVRLVGFRTFTTKEVQISVNNTTKLDATLEDESVTTQEVVVTATRPIVDVGSTSTIATVTDADIRKLPVQELTDIVNLQAGVVDGHFRGGRAGEVQYQVNGVSVNNPYDNTSTIRIDRSLIQEVQVITGTFDAEYGQAMSGVVNTVLKSGSESFTLDAEAFGGTFLFANGGKRGLDYEFHPASQNYQLSLSGPTGLPQTFFLVNARRYVFDDYLWGRELFTPTDSSGFQVEDPRPTGSNKEVALAYQKEWSGLAKVTNRSIGPIEISYSFLFNVMEAKKLDGAWDWRLNPAGRTSQKTTSYVHGLDFTHTLSPTTFYAVNVRQNYFDYHDWLYDDFYDTRYEAAGPPQGFPLLFNSAIVQGADFNRFRQKTDTWVAKASVTSQVSRAHQLKAGAEFQTSKMQFGAAGTLVYQGVEGQQQLVRYVNKPPEYPGVQTFKPVQGAAFMQDMIEWNDLTIRAGVRGEFFNPRSVVPSDLANPANAIPGAPQSVMKKTRKKWSVAPRMGLSYPITERSSIFFSYGHFYQLPNLGDMFRNLNYERLQYLQAGASDYGVLANPDVKPQKTVHYEFGYKNAVTDWLGVTVNLFYKDIRDLLGVQFVNTYTGAQYARLSNIDFGNVTGFTLSLDQRRIGLVSSTIDYTWQMAQGNSSDPQETANLAEAGFDAKPRQVPFNWDQRHTLNMTIQLSDPESYAVSAVLRYGSGQPYTPAIGSGFGAQIEHNSGRKPDGFLVDLRLEKYLKIGSWNTSLFARVFNLLNATYFNGFVFNNTGSPDYSLNPTGDRFQLVNPTRYYAPRRIELGVSLNSIL